jgi:hypothetical protein
MTAWMESNLKDQSRVCFCTWVRGWHPRRNETSHITWRSCMRKDCTLNKFLKLIIYKVKGKGKAAPLQAWIGPGGSRKLRFPDLLTMAQDGGKVVSITHRPPLPPRNTPGTHFCYRPSRPQGHSATGRIMSLKYSSDTNGNRTRDLPVCIVVS